MFIIMYIPRLLEKKKKIGKNSGGEIGVQTFDNLSKAKISRMSTAPHSPHTLHPSCEYLFIFLLNHLLALQSCNDVVAAKLFVREGRCWCLSFSSALATPFLFPPPPSLSFQQSKKFLWLDGATRKARLIQKKKVAGRVYSRPRERGPGAVNADNRQQHLNLLRT